MSRILVLVLSFCLPLLFSVSSASTKDCFYKPADDCPSEAAQKLPGALGKKGLTAIQLGLKKEIHETTYWYDTDGVDPAVAGCHIGVTDGTDKKKKNGRTFGEACINDVVLIESNRAPLVVHPHKGDHGHPGLFNCNNWCKGIGKASGRCEAVSANLEGCTKSARCACN